MGERLTFEGFWTSLGSRTDELFVGAEHALDGPAFRRACLAVADEVSTRGWRTVGIHALDSGAFAAGVFGAIVAGAMPEVLPHTRPGFMSKLAGEVDGLAVDYPLPAACGMPSIAIAAAATPLPAAAATPAWDRAAETAGVSVSRAAPSASCPDLRWPSTARIGFRTSGSSGAAKRVVKSLDAIETELTALETRFGAEIPDAFAGTVDHQHYYGATGRILWPLLGGRSVLRNLMRYPSDVMSAALGSVAIVTSPTFLVGVIDLLNPEDLRGRRFRLFSAGAPLPRDTAERLNSAEPWLVAEIFGSTESGAICSRIPGAGRGPDAPGRDDDAWTVLPGVDVSVGDGRILVDWHTRHDAGTVELGDSGERLPDGRLRLFGRRDRIVKIREKRVSLAAVEAELAGHPFVCEAAAVVLPRHGLSELGVVVAPTEAGFTALESDGHRALAERLQRRLRDSFDPTTVPKKWRFVRALPRNGMAKVTQESLVELFANGTLALPDALPQVVADSSDGLARTVDLRIDEQLRWFRGHFPSVPVLPGVVQLDWAAHFGAPLTKHAGRFERLQRVKFNHAMLPGVDVRLALRYDAEKRSLSFTFSNAERTFSAGRFVYA
jgi:acyl-CoA synthetase (AMP-forming)/AMP-acid ligase II/3-hydroxymyristoyl/3-hydroxydecanoyl-(acyl carrier protein) dehydratase